jgi:hypothetical protein
MSRKPPPPPGRNGVAARSLQCLVRTFVNGIGSTYLTAYKVDDGAGNWENRFGVIASGTPDTITNAGFISSSSGSPVTFLAGTKTVTCVPMSELFLTAAVSPVLVETSIVSATTTDLGSIQTLRALVTGTTTITGFGTSPNTLRFVRFSGVLTLTYNASSLILMGGASRTTAAGDIGLYISDGSGNWTELFYNRATGLPGCMVDLNGSNQTGMTAAANNRINFSNAVRNDGSYFDTATNHRFTPPAGVYLVVLAVPTSTSAAETGQPMIYKNGSELFDGTYLSQGSATLTGANGLVTAIVPMNGTDYLEGWVYLPATVTSVTGNVKRTYMHIYKMRDN